MKRKNPNEPNGWTFIVGGGRTIKDGKAHWPDCVAVFMPRQRAYDILHSLAVQLGEQELDEISLSWCGALEADDA